MSAGAWGLPVAGMDFSAMMATSADAISNGAAAFGLNGANGISYLVSRDAQLMRIPPAAPVAPSLVPHMSVPSVNMMERTKASHYVSMVPAPTTTTITSPSGAFESGLPECVYDFWFWSTMVLLAFILLTSLYNFITWSTERKLERQQLVQPSCPSAAEVDMNIYVTRSAIDYENPVYMASSLSTPPKQYDIVDGTPVEVEYVTHETYVDHSNAWEDDPMYSSDPSAPGPEVYEEVNGTPVAHDLINDSIYMPPPKSQNVGTQTDPEPETPQVALDRTTFDMIDGIIRDGLAKLNSVGEASMIDGEFVNPAWSFVNAGVVSIVNDHAQQLLKLLDPHLQKLDKEVADFLRYRVVSNGIERIRWEFLWKDEHCSFRNALRARSADFKERLRCTGKELGVVTEALDGKIAALEGQLEEDGYEQDAQMKAFEIKVAALEKEIKFTRKAHDDDKEIYEREIAALVEEIAVVEKEHDDDKECFEGSIEVLEEERECIAKEHDDEAKTPESEVNILEGQLACAKQANTDLLAITSIANASREELEDFAESCMDDDRKFTCDNWHYAKPPQISIVDAHACMLAHRLKPHLDSVLQCLDMEVAGFVFDCADAMLDKIRFEYLWENKKTGGKRALKDGNAALREGCDILGLVIENYAKERWQLAAGPAAASLPAPRPLLTADDEPIASSTQAPVEVDDRTKPVCNIPPPPPPARRNGGLLDSDWAPR